MSATQNLGKLLNLKYNINKHHKEIRDFIDNNLKLSAEEHEYNTDVKDKLMFEMLKITNPEFEFEENGGFYWISWLNAKEGKALELKNITDNVINIREDLDAKFELITDRFISTIENEIPKMKKCAEWGFVCCSVDLEQFEANEIRKLKSSKKHLHKLFSLYPDLDFAIDINLKSGDHYLVIDWSKNNKE